MDELGSSMSSKVRKIIESLLHGCRFCGETTPSVLDEHHIVFRSEGGGNERSNLVVACANCHRKVHSGEIRVDGWYETSSGLKLHCWIADEELYL